MWWRIVKNLTVPASPNAVPVKIFPATFADEAVVLPLEEECVVVEVVPNYQRWSPNHVFPSIRARRPRGRLIRKWQLAIKHRIKKLLLLPISTQAQILHQRKRTSHHFTLERQTMIQLSTKMRQLHPSLRERKDKQQKVKSLRNRFQTLLLGKHEAKRRIRWRKYHHW